jgi:hypothetical protein
VPLQKQLVRDRDRNSFGEVCVSAAPDKLFQVRLGANINFEAKNHSKPPSID